MLIPTFTVRDIAEAVRFHTEVLDFQLTFVMNPDDPFYAVLERGGDELHLSLRAEGGVRGSSAAIVVCDDVDALYGSFKARGLSVPIRPESPAHEKPLDQTWGTREVYSTTQVETPSASSSGEVESFREEWARRPPVDTMNNVERRRWADRSPPRVRISTRSM